MPRPHRSGADAENPARVVTEFPGLYCPGLIEARAGPGLAPPRRAFPGLYCPGLIEAMGAGRAPIFNAPGFPGLYCPGLIEAASAISASSALRNVSGALLPRPHRSTISFDPFPKCQMGFRGSIAPASSKLRPSRRGSRPPAVFPGLYCPGLIEARVPRPSPRRASRVSGALLPRPHRSPPARGGGGAIRGAVSGALLPRPHRSNALADTSQTTEQRFRGSIAPASSKRRRARPPVRRGGGFRGSIAPASSKLRREGPGGPRLDVSGALLPRPHRSRRWDRLLAATEAEVSGALLPRPHRSTEPGSPKRGACGQFPGLYCPGLIEAGQGRAGEGRCGPVSGALLPRPHRSRETRPSKPVAWVGFRGSIAPASSKRRRDGSGRSGYRIVSGALLPRPHRSSTAGRGEARQGPAFPGLYCPGLIEARPSHSPPGRCPRFRGSIAPASSKPGWEGAAHWCGPPVSGALLPRPHRSPSTASASAPPPEFPGLYCPGLIEADLAVACSLGEGAVSGALLPRPHRSA